eukprot:scaffold254674_cov68-Attheya_sp.AAC.1
MTWRSWIRGVVLVLYALEPKFIPFCPPVSGSFVVDSSGLSTDVTAETLGLYQRVRSEISTPLESWAPLLGAPRPGP